MPPLSAFLVTSGLLGPFALLKLLTTATIGGNVLQASVLFGTDNAKFLAYFGFCVANLRIFCELLEPKQKPKTATICPKQ